MDKKEQRKYIGQTHYAPEMNPAPPNKRWFGLGHKETKSRPVTIQRQGSLEDMYAQMGPAPSSPSSSSPPVGSPTGPMFMAAMMKRNELQRQGSSEELVPRNPSPDSTPIGSPTVMMTQPSLVTMNSKKADDQALFHEFDF